ncbi:MAG: hypothetical protein ABIU77_14410 [Ferruginibacter sp.]
MTITTFLLLSYHFSFAHSDAENPAKHPHDWWRVDRKKDSLPCICLNRAYQYLKGRKSTSVIVAIIDNFMDTAYEEFKDFIWTNKKKYQVMELMMITMDILMICMVGIL